MAPVANGTSTESAPASTLPTWLNNVTLEKAVREHIGDYAKIHSVTPATGTKAGENYSSLMLRLAVEVELKDGSTKHTSFVLKALHSNEMMAQILTMLKVFTKEEAMYHTIVPKFEQLYKGAGKSIQFAPKAYKFDRDVGVDYVLLEDLRERNFKNANRLAGFDMEHMKAVLTKMAEFHAASACYVEHFGMFAEEFTVGVFNESNRNLLKEFNESGAFLAQLKKWKDGAHYYAKLADTDVHLVDRLLAVQKINSRDFNVLNHGDCWANNIMFQYDGLGKIKNTLFVDFQVGKYGSPAYDLYYTILSSAAADIKLSQFDYFVRFYFDNLVENLKLLQYHRPLPKLKNLHATLLKNGLAAYMVVSKVLPVVILEKTDCANLENYIEDESKMKNAMFTNPKYVQAMNEILPWLDNRGLLDWMSS